MKTKGEIFIHEITGFKTKEQLWNPYAWFQHMREKNPVYYDAEQDVWNVFRYEDAKRVLSDHQLFSSVRERSIVPVPRDNSGISLTLSDPPIHRKRRALIAKAFVPRSLEQWKPKIQAIVDRLLDNMQTQSTVDIVKAYAVPLPVTVIADLLGVPSRDWAQIKRWSNILFMGHHRGSIEHQKLQKDMAMKEFSEYLRPLVLEKRAHPQDDILSDLAMAEYEGSRLTDEEIVRTGIGLLGAGNETTTTLITNCFYCLLYDQPSAYEELHQHPELVPQAIDEALRYRFHICIDRTITQDTNVFGPPMKKGQIVIAWMSSANRDDRQFAHPEKFDIHRTGNDKHLTFGSGHHFCLGAPLARLEAEYALTSFVIRFPSASVSETFRLDEHMPDHSHKLSSLPIRIYG
ncbi:cytochrome P450 [Paenibacillus alvei]|uniref:Cytochrome P450 n=1 Tax=Paenibacillus alvei TaxID=44250 RepID=A0AAP7DIA6_PAEAL|nr:cytochrome P450 [Paenibacillus alvei]NOJ70491.1 cytochrome P450 [Paenibacillus alvei]